MAYGESRLRFGYSPEAETEQFGVAVTLAFYSSNLNRPTVYPG